MTRRTDSPRMSGKTRIILILVILAIVTSLVGMAYWYSQNADETQQEVSQPPVEETNISTAPTNRPVNLKAIIPSSLSDEQRFGIWVVEQVLDDPERWVEKEKVEMSDNDQQVFIALILTESSFRQFADDGSTLDSGIDCDGLAQLCNNPAVCPPDDRWNPFENVYCGMRYFKELVEKWSGDYGMAVAEYKGAINKRADGTTVPNPEHSVVQDLFDHLALR